MGSGAACVMFLVCCGLCCCCAALQGGDKSERRPLFPPLSPGQHHPQCPKAERYIQDTPKTALPLKEPPSGTWRGYYNQYGRDHQVCEFQLKFDNGQVSGEGVDDIGQYTIKGVYKGGRVAFAKEYQADSLNADGRRNRQENLGHLAEYRAEPAGSEIGQGLRGTWYVKTSVYQGTGRFHLWPDVDLYSAEAAAAGEAFLREHPTFEVSSDNICAVCFDRPIDVVIDPCGHIVICADCSGRLNPRKCPICRDPIRQILPAKSQPGMSRQLSAKDP